LGRRIPDALRAAGYQVERHDDHFDTRTPDEDWLPEVARRGWIALSHNKQIRRTALERDAAMRGGLALFLLIGRRHDEIERNLIVTVPRIIAIRERTTPPFIAHVRRPDVRFPIGSRPGIVEVVLSEAQWRERQR
jgi:hypothetical protein